VSADGPTCAAGRGHDGAAAAAATPATALEGPRPSREPDLLELDGTARKADAEAVADPSSAPRRGEPGGLAASARAEAGLAMVICRLYRPASAADAIKSGAPWLFVIGSYVTISTRAAHEPSGHGPIRVVSDYFFIPT